MAFSLQLRNSMVAFANDMTASAVNLQVASDPIAVRTTVVNTTVVHTIAVHTAVVHAAAVHTAVVHAAAVHTAAVNTIAVYSKAFPSKDLMRPPTEIPAPQPEQKNPPENQRTMLPASADPSIFRRNSALRFPNPESPGLPFQYPGAGPNAAENL